jgi:hypothetical protein
MMKFLERTPDWLLATASVALLTSFYALAFSMSNFILFAILITVAVLTSVTVLVAGAMYDIARGKDDGPLV